MQQAQSLLLLPILILFSPPIVIVLVPFGHIAQLAIVDTIFQLTSLKDMKPTRLFKQLAQFIINLLHLLELQRSVHTQCIEQVFTPECKVSLSLETRLI